MALSNNRSPSSPHRLLESTQKKLVLYIKSYEINSISATFPLRMLLNSPISGRSNPPGQVASTMGSECTKTHIPTRPKRSTVFSNRPPAWRNSSKKTTEDNFRTLWKWVDSTCDTEENDGEWEMLMMYVCNIYNIYIYINVINRKCMKM